MKLLITGDRYWEDTNKIIIELEKYDPENTVLIFGDASGADTITWKLAKKMRYSFYRHKANWKKYGRAAGPIRNKEMLDRKPDKVLAFHSDIENSRGTKNCKEQAEKLNISVELIV